MIEKRKLEIQNEVKKIIQNPDIKVFFLYALPEIEAWFISDWENTFEQEYKKVLSDRNAYFSITFRKFILNNVLTEQYALDEIENYGYINSKYQKLSDKIIDSFKDYSYCVEKYKNNEKYDKFINRLIKDDKIKYSKKVEGINMLRRLDPEKVAVYCKYYFSKVYVELKFESLRI